MTRIFKPAAIALMVAGITFGLAAPAAAKSPPKSCARALDAAEEIIDLNAEFAEEISAYFSSLSDAATDASDSGDMLGFLEDMTSLTGVLDGTIQELTSEVSPVVSDYERSAAQCRRGK